MAIEITSEDIQLLYLYLSKMYSRDIAKELLLKHKDNLWGDKVV